MADPLSAKFSALSDPTRRAILARLALGETTLSDLAQPLAMSTPGVAKHLDVLERAGLIARGARSVVRPVRLQPDAFAEMSHWIDACRQHWEGSFDRLAAHLAATADEPDAP
ncbi:metalloregulator ArsR/SmtB family transcription factor [Methylobacterium durans]|uniref:ArsR/SmtB family transcription factor n=1 Tax=Methylobacterium durans TaxID=2202825 RepID=UPI002AFEDAA3|nr:metalloregulator ArsR/SmtB family transcription factor [Methylobacterium durans]MEA1832611.1 metalloregulator ArsR/SmtB family transcription factor [Methylobacterium durans]